jgi:hypothetical protein
MDKIFDFDAELTDLNNSIADASHHQNDTMAEIQRSAEEIDELYKRLKNVPGIMRVLEEDEITNLDSALESLLPLNFKSKSSITLPDITVAVLAGFVAAVIDIVFVGTPEVVRIYKGGENFDGSIFTTLLRKIGANEDKGSILKWLSEKCKVPYDLSAMKDTVQPNNHRLRNPGHDPLIGLLFAVVDILMGTATLIDNKGGVKVVIRDDNYPPEEKLFAVVYYIGHLISDICTSRGLPIPGFFLTQFFTKGKYGPNKESIAKIVENMYKDGYDLRHLLSMTSPVMVKDFIVSIYYYIFYHHNSEIVDSIANREIAKNKYIAHKFKLIAISDAIACSGNIVKFFLSGTAGNITAFNLSEWISLIKNGAISLKYDFRDKTVETAIYNRTTIDDNWKKLSDNCEKLINE